jgi:maltooligosyltrehalose trehalohydrolase
MPFGAELTTDGVRFALWAPTAERVELSCGGRRLPVPAAGQGWFKLIDPAARAGDRYAFHIDSASDPVPDPASRLQPEDHDRHSAVVDPTSYDWRDASWRGRSWNEAVICEIHVGTATSDGTYAALQAKLEHYKSLGITALQLMPIAETTGQRTWGYDGVLPFAPNNAYGPPDALKAFVDAAHNHGLMVLLDVVYNHFGPTGNFLHSYAKAFFTERHHTPWGAAINFDGRSAASDVVRAFFIHNALYWLEEYHLDGLRFDAVHAIIDESDTHFLDDLAKRVRDAFPDRQIHLILENEKNEAHRLVRDGTVPIAYNAQWDDDWHHCWHVLLTGENEGYYGDFGGDTVARLGRALAEGFVYQGEHAPNLNRSRGEPTEGLPPQAFVSFLQNHDQIGNRAQGERLTELADPAKLALARASLYLCPQIPMIFMGEEWGAQTRFQYFVHFEREPELEDAIRKGRANEFKSFKAFKGEDTSVIVPDPTDEVTFLRSKLDWSEPERRQAAEILAETRALLKLRHEEIVPLLESAFVEARSTRLGAGGLHVEWDFEEGRLGFLANFAATDLSQSLPEGAKVLWASQTIKQGPPAVLKAWTGLVYKSARP